MKRRNACSAVSVRFCLAFSGFMASSSVEIPRRIGKKASIPFLLHLCGSFFCHTAGKGQYRNVKFFGQPGNPHRCFAHGCLEIQSAFTCYNNICSFDIGFQFCFFQNNFDAGFKNCIGKCQKCRSARPPAAPVPGSFGLAFGNFSLCKSCIIAKPFIHLHNHGWIGTFLRAVSSTAAILTAKGIRQHHRLF